MAGPSFFTPQRVTPSRPIRRFTLDQANRSLSLVRKIVGDIVSMHKKATGLQARIESASGREQATMQGELDRSLERLQGLVDELSDVGCEIKDYQTGLIDFVGRHQGRDVCLCWKLGEEQIGFFHELKSGFAGRQPVSLLEEDE